MLSPGNRTRRRFFARPICYAAIFALAVLLLYFWKRWMAPEPPKAVIQVEQGKVGSTVLLEVYMESKCPDTTYFMENELQPTWESLSSVIDLRIVPFGKASCSRVGGDDFSCSCQHGPRECAANQLMNCVIDKYPNVAKHFPAIMCLQGKDVGQGGHCLANMDKDDLMACANGKKGRQLLAAAGEKTGALSPRLHFVPWIVLNGQRDAAAFRDLKGAVCKRLDPKPKQC